MTTKIKKCKDCEAEGVKALRPTPFPGPRCTTHHREVTKARRSAIHEKSVQRTYGLAPGDYQRIYEHQSGVCAGCQRAKGTGRRKLAVDHDHKTGMVRGLLCSTCNEILGHYRDDPRALMRLAEYLVNPPARAVLRASEQP